MSTVNNGPQIVRTGLILDLDAGNGKSYSTNRFQSLGSGTVTENVTFPIQGTGTFQRVASGTVIGGYTVRPNDVVYSYVLGVLGCHYHGNSAPIPAGSYATFSFDYLVTGATTYPIADLLATFEGVASGGGGTANSLQNVWQRRSFTSAIISTSGNMNMYLYPGACGGQRLADSGTIYYRNPKVEITNVDTGNSTFSSTSNIGLWYDLSGNGRNGTLNGPTSNVSNKGNILFNGSTQDITLPSNFNNGMTSGTWEFWLNSAALPTSGTYQQLYIQENSVWLGLYNPSGVVFFGSDLNNGSGWFDTNGGNVTGAKTTSTLSANTWYHILYSWDGSTIRIYLNGSLESTTSTLQAANGRQNVTILGAGTTPRTLGGRSQAGYYFNGKISMFRNYNAPLSAAEVLQNYNATKTRFGL